MAVQLLKIGLVDMNNGVANQAVRSFRSIIAAFGEKASAANPQVRVQVVHCQPRNLGEDPPEGCDLYISSGGPDAPVDGFKESWTPGYRAFLDRIVDGQIARGRDAPAAFVVCYSFEIAVMHFGIAAMEPRKRKFGSMPVYPTEEGMQSPLFRPFGDRLFAWEHRSWEAVDLDETKLSKMGGELYARESRDGVSKGRGLMAFRFSPGLEGTIFHPEADRPGVLNWIQRPEQAKAVIDAYGDVTYQRMLKTIDDPTRLARTYALLLPGWLARSFNALAFGRGWNPVSDPSYDGVALGAFESPIEEKLLAGEQS